MGRRFVLVLILSLGYMIEFCGTFASERLKMYDFRPGTVLFLHGIYSGSYSF